mmetsp:Transcript_13058/g.25003  ORF Transcript_13058/g.25003 Transcript_13058/m.25003 type:complete len:156 (+) Transcript_13058:1242-1709(+)
MVPSSNSESERAKRPWQKFRRRAPAPVSTEGPAPSTELQQPGSTTYKEDNMQSSKFQLHPSIATAEDDSSSDSKSILMSLPPITDSKAFNASNSYLNLLEPGPGITEGDAKSQSSSGSKKNSLPPRISNEEKMISTENSTPKKKKKKASSFNCLQ